MEETIKVGLVEDQHLFRQGMKAMLSRWPEIEVAFESPDGYSVHERLRENQVIPDVMLIDLSLPSDGSEEFNGWRVVQLLKSAYPDMGAIILSVHEDEYLMAQLIEQGANAYLAKDCDPQEVYDAIVAVHNKGSYINERVLKAIRGKLGGKVRQPKTYEDLSKREVEVLRLVCQQKTAQEIADELFISVKTVNGHRNNLMQKTGSKNVTGLVMYAVKHRIVEFV